MNIQKILVPISPEQTVTERFHQIFQFANKKKVSVTLLSVIEQITPNCVAQYTQQASWEILDQIKNEQQKKLESDVNALSAQYKDCAFNYELVSGIPFVEIIKKASEGKFNLIAIDAGRGYKSRAAQFGSTTRHLMRKSPTPLWTVVSDYQAKINRVLAAVDVAAPTDDGLELNKKIISCAAAFAATNEAELYVFHAWRLFGEGYFRSWGRLSELEIAEYALKERDARNEKLTELTRPVEEAKITLHQVLSEGEPEEILPAFINQNGVDLLVMGTVCRTGIAGFLIGNKAENLLDAVRCSVITLKPEHFDSPVLG
ncbi:universal stress protein [Zooshikella marina]|uniref:universal stress protein n=1 Tax=Zooshikella ganghwensis TaxID=202772 RepID=UPI001BAF1937|nr:universal stress protein [Zooshikella ganghwensis]MBU2708063.1 universal stress protein [Zooshikella ganghwensis]